MRRSVLSLAAAALAATAAPVPSYAATGVFAMDGTMQVACYGCGSTTGSISANAAGAFDIGAFTGALTASLSVRVDSATCPVLASGVGTYTWGPFSGPIDFTIVGIIPSFWMKLPDGTWIHHWGKALVTNPVGNPCGGPASLSLVTAGATENVV